MMTADAAAKRQAEDSLRSLRWQLAVFGALGLSGLVLSYLHILEAVRSAGVRDWTSYALSAAPDVFVVALAYRALWLASLDRRHRAEVAGTLAFLGATLAANLYVAPVLDVPTLIIYGAPAVVAAAGFMFAEMALRDTRAARELLAALADIEPAPRPARPRRRPEPARAPEPEPARAPEPTRAPAAQPPAQPQLRAVPETVTSHCARADCDTCADIRNAVEEGCALTERALAAHLGRGGTALRPHLRAVRIEIDEKKEETA